MSYKLNVIDVAKRLRSEGYSYGEIAKKLNTAKSTAYFWVNKIKLDKKALKELENKRILSRLKALRVLKELRESKIKKIKDGVNESLINIRLNKINMKLLSSFLYWAEGGKTQSNRITFVNSDPQMIMMFLKLLRLSFEIDESKFRCLIHLHNYHVEKEIKKYWSNITNIPLDQFNRSYQKQNTGKRIRKGYKGCLSLSYFDWKIALEIRLFYNMFTERFLDI